MQISHGDITSTNPAVIKKGSNGEIFIAWMKYKNGGTVNIQAINSDGSFLWNAYPIGMSRGENKCQMAPHIGGQDSEGNLYIFWSGCYSGFAKADLFGQKISLNGELLWEKGGRKILEGGQFISLPSRIRNDTIFLVYKDPVYSLDSYQNLNAIAIDTSGRYCWEAPLVLNSEQTYKNYLSLSDIVDGQGVVCFGSHDRWGNSSGQIKLQNFWVDGSLGSKNTFIQDNMIATSNAKIWYIPDQNVIKVINCESLRRCSLFDLYGHLIKSISVENTPNNKFTFSCHEIPNGIYIVKVTSDACVYTQMLYLY